MALRTSVTKRVFHFTFDARTSRGRMKDKTSWFIHLWDDADPHRVGVGECGPLPGLSPDDKPDFENVLHLVLKTLEQRGSLAVTDIPEIVTSDFPSIAFGLETALLDLQNGGTRTVFRNSFVEGKPIAINGLVWMGDLDQMLQQASLKIDEGYRTIKIKVGGLNFEKECDILHYLRRKYFKENLTLRLDANGSFKPEEALYKLNQLARFGIHSIEQPLKPGSPYLKELCASSPIPIALDEELIGVHATEAKLQLLQNIRPSFIILKPTLLGGFAACREWIDLAERLNIGWWMTSALESNIGLNAISQFTANYLIQVPQGLGTGQLYHDNIDSPLQIKRGELFYNATVPWGEVRGHSEAL